MKLHTETNVKLPLYTSVVRTRRASRVATERSRARTIAGQNRHPHEACGAPSLYRQWRRQNKTRQMRNRHILAGTGYLPQGGSIQTVVGTVWFDFTCQLDEATRSKRCPPHGGKCGSEVRV